MEVRWRRNSRGAKLVLYALSNWPTPYFSHFSFGGVPRLKGGSFEQFLGVLECWVKVVHYSCITANLFSGLDRHTNQIGLAIK